MEISLRQYAPAERTPQLVAALVEIWEASVRATHSFLSPAEIAQIKPEVPQALTTVAQLLVAEDASGHPLGFLGVQDRRLEMLFLAPNARGQGLGRHMMEYAMQHYAICTLTVNEQNPQAVAFYTHLGFRPYHRTPKDEQSRPYPLLYLRLPE